MEKRSHHFFSIILYIVLSMGFAVMLFNKHPYSAAALVVYLIFSGLVVYNNAVNQQRALCSARSKLFLIAELVLAIVLLFLDETLYPGFYFIILMGSAILTYPLRFAVPYLITAAAAQMLIKLVLLHFSLPPLMQEYQIYLIPRIIILLSFITARYAIKTGETNKQLVDQLSQKTKALEDSVEKQIEAADLRAKEGLMHELHDRLGHTLVTASIGIQAAQTLIDQDPKAAKDHLDTATQQVQTAMQSLRNVIRGMPDWNDQDGGLVHIIVGFIDETERRTGIRIHHNLKEDADEKDFPTQIHSFLYRALMEGITNGIRRGKATEFIFTLKRYKGSILFRLKDNGKGFKTIHYGYGLSRMIQEAEKLHASTQVSGEDGCLLEFNIPLQLIENGEY